MSIKGFLTVNGTEKYDYTALENLPNMDNYAKKSDIGKMNGYDNTEIVPKCFMPLAEDTAKKTIELDSVEGLEVGHWLVKAKFDSDGNFDGWQSRQIVSVTGGVTIRNGDFGVFEDENGDYFEVSEITLDLPTAGHWLVTCYKGSIEVDAKENKTIIIAFDTSDEYDERGEACAAVSILDEVDSVGNPKLILRGSNFYWGMGTPQATLVDYTVKLAGNFSYHPNYTPDMEPTVENGVVFYESVDVGTTDAILGDLKYIHLEGVGNTAAPFSVVSGFDNNVTAFNATVTGVSNTVSGIESTAEGESNTVSGKRAHVEGSGNTASGLISHAEGNGTTASGENAHSEGAKTKATGVYSHAEGFATEASGGAGHSEGFKTQATGAHSHAEGNETEAIGLNAHAEGNVTVARGQDSHAEGCKTEAIGIYSHAEGYGTIAAGSHSHVHGKYNIADTNNKYAHIVGNGSPYTERSNAHTLDWDGNAWYAGTVECSTPTKDGHAATKKYVDDTIKASAADIKAYIDEAVKNAVANLPVYNGEVL